MALTPGTYFGPYEIVGLLGAGGMGEVYRARDTKLDREVAIKVLPELFVSDPERVARFQREAKTLAALSHPHIGGIYGLEDADGVRALVLELVEGPTLADRIAQGPIPLDEALPIARQIAEALEAAHEQGIIHRDLKPANIKLRPDGTAKVLDFGLAKALEPTSAASPNVTASPTITTPAMMTGVGVIIGTAAYMSPEQAKGRPADKRSDVWAFGCVLYEMVSGRRAFEGEDVGDTLAAVIRGEPDWNGLPADVTRPIRLLIQRCLAKDRRQRIGDLSVAKFLIAEPGLGTHPGEAKVAAAAPTTPRSRAVLPVVAAVTATSALFAVAAVILWPSTSKPIVTRSVFPLPEGQTLTTIARSMLAISPDGTRLAYIASNRINLRSLSEFEGHAIPGTETAAVLSSPGFSPDGQSIVFGSAADRGLTRIAIGGGAGVKLCGLDDAPSGLSWDSTGIVFGLGPKGIFHCSPDGGTAKQIVTVKPDEEAYGPQMLPDGKVLIFTLAKSDEGLARWDKAQIVAQTVASGARKTLVDGGADARYLATGHLVYALGGVVYAVRFDAARQQTIGGAVPIIEGVRRAGATTGAAQFAVSSTGTLVYLAGPVRNTVTMERGVALADRAGVVTRLPLQPRSYTDVRVSRDGARLALGSDDGKQAIIWIHELAGSSEARRLTLQGQNRFPIWSADGVRIAFQSDREKDLAIFAQRADGTGPIERLTKPDQGDEHVPQSWSPDGRYLLFSVVKAKASSLWALSVADKKAAPFGDVQSAERISATFSPDGRWIAYSVGTASADPSSDRGIFLQPFPANGEKYQAPRRALDFHPVWSPKGGELIYVPSAASGQIAAVTVGMQSGVTFGSPVMLPARVTADRRSSELRAWDILPDGRFIGLALPSAEATGRVEGPQIRIVQNWFTELQQRVPTR